MGVRADDQVDAADLPGKFAVGLGSLAGQQDDQIGALPQRRYVPARCLDAVGERQALEIVGAACPVRVVIAERQDADPNAADVADQRWIAQERRPVPQDVRAAHRKPGDPLQLFRAVGAIIEVMVAQRHHVVADGVHDADDRLTSGKASEKIIAESVAAIQQENTISPFPPPDFPYRAGQMRRTADPALAPK